jgi:hypothetical protein
MKTVLLQDFAGCALKSLKKNSVEKLSTTCSTTPLLPDETRHFGGTQVAQINM